MKRLLVILLVGAVVGLGIVLGLSYMSQASLSRHLDKHTTPSVAQPEPTKPKVIKDFAEVITDEMLATFKEEKIMPITEESLDMLKDNQHVLGQPVIICGYVKSSLGNTLSLAVGKRTFAVVSPVQVEKGAIVATGTFQSDSVFIATEVKSLKKK